MKTPDMKIIERTMENLRKNNMEAYYAESAADVENIVKTLIKEGDVITHGGSETLRECGLLDLFKSGAYRYLDRSTAKTPEEAEKIYREAYFADAYFASPNALTEGGVLYNMDGNSNRVSAILYGPASVIFIAGYNKIVKDLDEAVFRVKSVAAPMNTKRLDRATYCRETGECLSLGKDASFICDGCRSKERICCNYVISAMQRHKGRMKVIIVGEKLGY